MDPSEEQEAELEALEAIFMDEYKLTDAATAKRGAHFSLSLNPEAAPEVAIRMDFEHTLSYPEEALVVSAHALSGLSAPRRKALQEMVNLAAEENIGMPSAFTICEAVKEWVEEHVAELGDEDDDDGDDGTSAFETRDVTTAAKVEVIASKAIGTPVTVESFSEWRQKFEAEMEAQKSAGDKKQEYNVKLSGRQLFEMNKAVVSVTGESESFWEQEANGYAEEG